MSQKAVKMQQDLEKKLEHLCFIHDQTALHVANEFYELRNTIDVDAEELLARFRQEMPDDADNEVFNANKTRVEFIRILRVLEQRCLSQLPETNTVSSAEAYGNFREKIESLKDCPTDRLKNVYIKLALELIEKTYELEKRLLGEQTLVYVFSGDKTRLGQLIHIGEFRMRRHEIDCLRTFKLSPTQTVYQKLSACLQQTLLTEFELPYVVDKSYMIFFRLFSYFSWASSGQSSYMYMAWDDQKRDGRLGEISSNKREFLSYRFPETSKVCPFKRVAGVAPSLDVLDYFSAAERTIMFFSSKLKNLDFLAHSSVRFLAEFCLFGVRLDVFDEHLIAKCVNLRKLVLEFDGATISSLGFLRSLKCLQSLSIQLRNLYVDPTVLKDLESIESLSLTSSKNEIKTPLKTRNFFKHLSAIPNLKCLHLISLDIDSIDRNAFAEFNKLTMVFLTSNTIGYLNNDAFNKGPNGKISALFSENTIKAKF